MIYTLLLVLNAIIWCCSVLVSMFARNTKISTAALLLALVALFTDLLMYCAI